MAKLNDSDRAKVVKAAAKGNKLAKKIKKLDDKERKKDEDK